jgi:exopolyphosphatase/pppGpp-phosphohydrolase
MLSQLSPQGRSALPGMTRGREHILPTGLCVLAALMKRFHIREMDVTARNNTDGYLFALMRGQEI